MPGEMPNYLQSRVNPGAGLGSNYDDVRPDDALGWNVGGQPDRAPAPDPLMAPAGMVANPYYYLPGNAAYIPQIQYDELMLVAGGPQYDAYDATLQTYSDPAKLGYDPGGAWQREEDYYSALKAKSDLGRATAGGYQEVGMEWVDGVGYVPWTDFTAGKYGTVSTKEFEDGPDTFNIRGLPQGVDTRVGDYYQSDGSVAYQGPTRPPALMPTNVSTPTGDVQGYESADFFIGGVPPQYRQGGSVGPVQWALSNDVSRSQPRADAFGDKGFYGAPGGVVTPGDPAYESLRGVSPSQIKLSNDVVTTDPNPFRGDPGTTSRFIAEDGDSPKVYPGVSFYEVGTDGQLKKVTAFTSGKEYFAVRENYDYTGFPMNPTMYAGKAGDTFTVRLGDGGDITTKDIDPEFSLTSITFVDPITGKNRTLSQSAYQEEYGDTIPRGSTLVLTKKASQWETPADNPRTDAVYDDAAGTYIDPNNGRMWLNDGTPGGTWVDPEDYAAAKKKEPYWDERYQAWVDPASNNVWRNEQEGWVPKPPIANDNLEQPPADDKGKPVETPKVEPLPPQIDTWLYSINAMKDNPYDRGKSNYEIPVPASLLGTNADDWPAYVDIVQLTTTSDGKPTTRVVKAGETLEPGKTYVIRVTKSDLTYVAKNPPKSKK